jgi:hypothetical protein
MENVVSDPRVISSCLPISMSLEGSESHHVGHGASFIGHPQAPGEVEVGAVVVEMLLAVRRLRPRLTR